MKLKGVSTTCSGNMTTDVWSYGFIFLKKSKVRKLWDLSWRDDIIRGDYGKNLRRFRTFCHIRCLEIELKGVSTTCSGNMTTDVWSYGFIFFKKSKVRKLWDFSWRDDIIRGDYGKNLRRFRTFCHIRCLEIEASQSNDCRVEHDYIRFGVKVTVERWFDYKIVCIGNREESLLQVNFW
jgi:hypothetical protein